MDHRAADTDHRRVSIASILDNGDAIGTRYAHHGRDRMSIREKRESGASRTRQLRS
jgi:hypothetical protein